MDYPRRRFSSIRESSPSVLASNVGPRVRSFGWRTSEMLLIGFAVLFLVSCATSNVESRKQERWSAYTALPPEQQALVDEGQIKVGMNADAVFIAWGQPAQILESETAQGRITTWVYQGQWMEETRYWTFREISRADGVFLERHLESDYQPRRYVSAEIVFENGVVKSWRTLPRP
jgi:hypothetical protein